MRPTRSATPARSAILPRILPVRSFNGAPVGDGKAPGPITKKLIDAYSKSVGCDFVAQYLKFSNAK